MTLWVGRLLGEMGHEVVVLNPRRVRGDSEFNGHVAIDDGLKIMGWNQVTAVGDLTATATCPLSQVVVFGLHWQMTTDGDADDGAFGSCTPGQTDCSATATATVGNDEVRVWMVCTGERSG